jgi:hypothetical protein
MAGGAGILSSAGWLTLAHAGSNRLFSKFHLKVTARFANGSPAANVHVTAHEVLTDNYYDLGNTNSSGVAEGDLREKRQVRVVDFGRCDLRGCPSRNEDDPLDRPSFIITFSDAQAHSFKTPPFPYGEIGNVLVVLPPNFTPRVPSPTPVGHILRRKNLSTDFTVNEQVELSNLIYGYLNDQVIDQHMKQVDHIEALFTDHRAYLYEMEKRLIRDGHRKYVPLPIWEPLNNIPDGWDKVKPLRGVPHPLLPYNASPLSARPELPDKLKPANMCGSNFDTAQDVAKAIGRSAWSAVGSYHFNAHAALGGPYWKMSTAASSVLFWAFHALLVEVYDKWLTCKFPGTSLKTAVGLNGDGRLELFTVASNNKLWHSWQRLDIAHRSEADEELGRHPPEFVHWSHWEQLRQDKDVVDVKAVTDHSGKLVLLAKGTDKKLYLTRQGAGGWTAWVDLGAEVSDFAAALNENNTLEVLAIRPKGAGLTNVVARCGETAPRSNSFGSWSEISALDYFHRIETVSRPGALPHAFVSGRVGGRLFHFWKRANGTWDPRYQKLSDDFFAAFRVHENQDGRLEVFALKDSDGLIYHKYVLPGRAAVDWRSASTWSAWEKLGSVNTRFGDLAVARNGDGRLEVFAIDSDGKVRHVWQRSPNQGWAGNWEEIPLLNVMGSRTRRVMSGLDSTGKLKVFVHAEDNFAYMAEQAEPNQGPWLGWTNI